ncbi:MAG: hypothetical protein AAF557_27720 [Pseudomonadota bacterium]
MARPATMTPIGADDLFEYPIATSERLDTHYFMMFHHRRWSKSDFRLKSDLDVRAVGLELFFVADELAPVGTLPTDEFTLAKLVGVTLEVWRSLAVRGTPPLYNWHRCITDLGETRLYHPVVLEMITGSFESRQRAEDKKERERERKRMAALPDQLVRAGFSPDLIDNHILLVQVDQYLFEHFPNRQRCPALMKDAVHAVMRGEA